MNPSCNRLSTRTRPAPVPASAGVRQPSAGVPPSAALLGSEPVIVNRRGRSCEVSCDVLDVRFHVGPAEPSSFATSVHGRGRRPAVSASFTASARLVAPSFL